MIRIFIPGSFYLQKGNIGERVNTGISNKEIIAGIDIGTTKICTIIADVSSNGDYHIIGVGKYPSEGLRKGLIVDLETTIASIRESKNIAERMAGVSIKKACVGITGNHIKSIPSSAVVAVNNPERGISADDKKRVLEVAKRIEMPSGQRLIDVLVRDYIVNSEAGIRDPLGMSGMRLEVNALLITGAIMHIENVYRAVEAADVMIDELFLEPAASGEAVLTHDEKESGVALVDIGGGTSDIAVYQDGCIAFTSILPIGGDHFDSDISFGLNINVKESERIKCLIGGVDKESSNSQEIITITKTGIGEEQKIPVKIISEIIGPRIEEILELIKMEISKAGFWGKIPSGLVITGGGSQLRGVIDVATRLMSMPVRIGRPHNISGLKEDVQNPIYATGVGLIKLAGKSRKKNANGNSSYPGINPNQSIMDRIIESMKKIFEWYSK